MGVVDHVGFAVEPDAVDELVAAVEAAGGAPLVQVGEGAERTVS